MIREERRKCNRPSRLLLCVCAVFKVRRSFGTDLTDRSLDGKPVHQPPVLLRGDGPGFLRIPGPVEMVSPGKAQGVDSHADPFEAESFDQAAPPSAEEIERAFLIRVEPEIQLDQGGEAVRPAPEVRSAADEDDFLESSAVAKHRRGPSGRCGASAPLRSFRRRSDSLPSRSSVPARRSGTAPERRGGQRQPAALLLFPIPPAAAAGRK